MSLNAPSRTVRCPHYLCLLPHQQHTWGGKLCVLQEKPSQRWKSLAGGKAYQTAACCSHGLIIEPVGETWSGC